MEINLLNLPKMKNGQYCFLCQSPMVQEKINRQNQVFYFCPTCRKQGSRVLEIDHSLKLSKTKQGWQHFTAGALIVDNFEQPFKFLIIKKRKHPYLYDVVAGHIEKKETPLKALIREAREEAGGMLKQKKLLLDMVINPDPCRRGVDIHRWFLFLCTLKNEIVPDKDEIANIKWYSKNKLQNLEFVAPTAKMLRLLKIIK
jgi:8-oxo-dGTP pyrophosphatase MutT (NUDIX family)